ncbi:signal recognition particle protein [Legionella longbeachae]|uniref:Signal recognition particle protein n=1 Tax=Legionella longbeachae serogroup 1 (strain NSW150) TaxID=661367 RepID=D3HLF9_LEGLN|nr:signal recognition particle protein [Legionella longbeachae]VEE03784.1 signal recognition particle protein Ffh [Legionella oakridgensis]HBD7397414.1 signal recognition particle protein [Legionella pneumophila]ARB93341.1 signal recognition particle protein [Legionella longbeachae]ARM33555.1 signal recognition particle protein [Legionella longbeachae]EEZ93583.1 signal recognition particle protein [Legionella longbeachae D-4968]
MFETLTERLTRTFKNLRGLGRLTEENVQHALREVRLSLLEADVALPVIKEFIEQVKQKALGQEVLTHLNPDQAFVKIVHDELIHVMGDERAELNFKTQPPAIFLMAGLQGSGKTTSTAKLARYLKESENKKVMVVSVDVYRPAAIQQLKVLAEQIGVGFFPAEVSEQPLTIARKALDAAKKQYMDVLIIDTAGRLHIDADMMAEIKELHQAVNPIETLFVVDSMTGQDAANTAKAFHEALPLTGVILTKTDGDARGGAALSVKQITGQPIKFIGSGEKVDALEPFHPERVASRILGMGDILTLIEEVERKADKQASEKLAKKLKKGKSFDLEDFKQQLLQMNNMGGISGMMSKLPGVSQMMPQQAMKQVSEKAMAQTIAIINSMTPKERRIPKIIVGSRKKRIAQGSGTQIQDVNKLLKQFEQMQKMMKKFTKPGGMQKMMRGIGGIPRLKGILPDDFK